MPSHRLKCSASAWVSRPTPQPKSKARRSRPALGQISSRYRTTSAIQERPVSRKSSSCQRPARFVGSERIAHSGSCAPARSSAPEESRGSSDGVLGLGFGTVAALPGGGRASGRSAAGRARRLAASPAARRRHTRGRHAWRRRSAFSGGRRILRRSGARATTCRSRGRRGSRRPRSECLQVRDRGCAVARVVPGPHAVAVLREVPTSATIEPYELVVTLADNRDRRLRRNGRRDGVADSLDEVLVGQRAGRRWNVPCGPASRRSPRTSWARRAVPSPLVPRPLEKRLAVAAAHVGVGGGDVESFVVEQVEEGAEVRRVAARRGSPREKRLRPVGGKRIPETRS